MPGRKVSKAHGHQTDLLSWILYLRPKKWRNIIRNVHSHTNIAIDSDHAIVAADIQIKLEAQNQPHDFKCRYSRFHKPKPEQILTCNNYIESKFVFDENSLESKLANCGTFVSLMVQDAHLSFQAKSPRQNRDYLSGQTWQNYPTKTEHERPAWCSSWTPFKPGNQEKCPKRQTFLEA